MNGRCVRLSLVCLLALTNPWLLSSSPASAHERQLPASIEGGVGPGPEDEADEVAAGGICAASDGRLPSTVRVDARFAAHVRTMLSRSTEFRRQCRVLAAHPEFYVRVQLSLVDLPAGVFAQSHVERTSAGPLMAIVQLAPLGNWSEWIGHEFEHLVEMADGMRVRDYRAGRGTWESTTDVYESARAIAAGRTIREEMRRRSMNTND